MDTGPTPLSVHEPYVCEELTWREWITIRRLRLGWTKEDLSKHASVTRRWLWRGLECPPGDERYVVLGQEVRERVEAALARGEAARDVEAAEAVA